MSRKNDNGRWSHFVVQKGVTQRGDEETEAFSDDEGDKDSPEKRRQNKRETQVVHAHASILARAIPKIKAFAGGVAGKLQRDDQDTTGAQLAIPVEGVTSFSSKSVEAARELDRSSETNIYQRAVNRRTEMGLDQRAQQTYITFNVRKLIELFNWSEHYKFY